jgi:hypothetical protein
MATFAEIQTAVSKRLLDANNTAVSVADVAAAVNSAIKYWKFRRFWFNEVNDSATMTIQDGTIPLPSDFLVPAYDDGAFRIEYSESRYSLTKLSTKEYNDIYAANGFGLPRFYAPFNPSQYEVYPLPDRDYTITRAYLKDYAPLVNGTDTNDFTIYADRLITLWAAGNLSGELRQDDKMESYFRNAAMDEFRQLTLLSDKISSSGSLSINSCLM